MSKHTIKTEFVLEGTFLGFLYKDGYKIRSLHLVNDSGDYVVKLPKPARVCLRDGLALGQQIRVTGDRKLDVKEGTITFRASHVAAIAPPPEPACSPGTVSPTCHKPEKPQATIRLCQKSDCWKRGGKAVFQELKDTLEAQGLGDQVTIKLTGCMKRCKAGPNLVMPDKTRHSKVAPQSVPALLEQHGLDKCFSS
jgi:(2Fe-2S) ferredoxin